jgi:hypothetical protein
MQDIIAPLAHQFQILGRHGGTPFLGYSLEADHRQALQPGSKIPLAGIDHLH